MKNITTQFKAGQIVYAREYGSNQWRLGYVSKPAPYPRGGCDGAYVTWIGLDFAKTWQSFSGWKPAHSIKVCERQDWPLAV